MSELYLLDTSVVLFLVRGQELGSYIETTFGLRGKRSAISVVTHGEVRVLARRNNWKERKLNALQSALDDLVTVDINIAEVIDAYVEIDIYSQDHPAGSRNMGKNDLWIAACAKASGSTLLTTDKDFSHLNPSLLGVEYIDPTSKLPPSSETTDPDS